jgi:hypothetical protein
LYCKTWRGYLELGSPLPQEEEEQEDDDWCPLYSLSNSDGNWAGAIYLHSPPESTNKMKEKCELIRISGGFVSEDKGWIPEWNFPSRSRLGDSYHFYHVLWIEWQGGIAYRRGLGHVVRHVWDDLLKNEVEILSDLPAMTVSSPQ